MRPRGKAVVLKNRLDNRYEWIVKTGASGVPRVFWGESFE
jgi:hypothetical protein